MFRQNAGLKWKARSIRRDGHECRILSDHAFCILNFLVSDVAEYAALLQLVILACALHFVDYAARHNRQRDQLAMGMFNHGSGGFSVILEDENVLETAVLFPIPLAGH